MFVNIIRFPEIRKGKDGEFRQWFEWSNTVYGKFPGFISRKLLKPEKGRYAAVVEHESKETFMAMHLSKERAAAFDRVKPLFKGGPKPSFYEVVIASTKKC